MAEPMTLPEAALDYARRGISVFPLKPRSKEPLTPNGNVQATTDLDQVRRWWRKTPQANIGIATGAPSWTDDQGRARGGAGFWVLDVDGEGAEAALAALEARHGALPLTVQQTTGRGRHLCFRWDPAGPEMRNRAKVGGADIDVRGNGGYIVAPPSIHPGDAKKGIPPGRVYGWSWGRAPADLPFADAPAWLVDLCRPRDQVRAQGAPAADRDAGPRPAAGGRATRYGEVVLEACVRTIAGAVKGTRDSTLYRFACKAAGLVPTGHLEAGYLREALLHAGAGHVPDAMSQAQLERQVDRAIAWGAEHGWGPAPERRRRSAAPSGREAAAGPVAQAVARADGVDFLEGLPCVGAAVLKTWCDLSGLRLDGVISAYVHELRQARGGLVLPLRSGPGEPPDGAALFGLGGGGACLGVKGLSEGRVGVLAWPDTTGDGRCDQVVVAATLADAWALGQAAAEAGDPMGVVVAPRLSTFAGGPLGDRYGRVNPDMPEPDPDRPPWMPPADGPPLSVVYLAVRRDLAGPELRVRRLGGGTVRRRLSGDDAARFWGGLAAAAWRMSGRANAVRVVWPPAGQVGFCDSAGGA